MKGQLNDFVFQPGVVKPESENDDELLFLFYRDKLLFRVLKGEITIPSRKDVKGAGVNILRSQYLGALNGQNCYSAEVAGMIPEIEGMEFMNLRSILGTVSEDMFFLSARAFQIMDWDRSHQFCSRCGASTREMEGERAKVCPKCGYLAYPRIAPAIIVSILNGDKILLAHNRNFRNNIYSLIAGYVEPGETFEQCVAREVGEEVGIRVKNIRYFGSQPWPFPYSIMVAYTAEYDSGEITPDGLEIVDAGWYRYDRLPSIPSKGSVARKLIDLYIESFNR